MSDEDTCALCGGELVEEAIHEDREAALRENVPDLEEKDLHARVCQACGHVSYHKA